MKKPKYPWPSSAITEKEMAKLFTARQETGRPISKLLRDAVNSQVFIPVLKIKVRP